MKKYGFGWLYNSQHFIDMIHTRNGWILDQYLWNVIYEMLTKIQGNKHGLRKKVKKNYCKNLKPDTQTNAPTKKKPSAKKNENSVLTELAKLIAKHKWTQVHVM